MRKLEGIGAAFLLLASIRAAIQPVLVILKENGPRKGAKGAELRFRDFCASLRLIFGLLKSESCDENRHTDARTPAATAAPTRFPFKGWALELARRWNGGTYSLFVLHGNIFDLFPVQDETQVELCAAEDLPDAPAVPGARLPAVLRHLRRPDLRLGRDAEAVFRVAGSLRQRREHELPRSGPPRDFLAPGAAATPLLPAGRRGEGAMARHHAGDRFPGEADPRLRGGQRLHRGTDEPGHVPQVGRGARTRAAGRRRPAGHRIRRRTAAPTCSRNPMSPRCGSICPMPTSGSASSNPAGRKKWRAASLSPTGAISPRANWPRAPRG